MNYVLHVLIVLVVAAGIFCLSLRYDDEIFAAIGRLQKWLKKGK